MPTLTDLLDPPGLAPKRPRGSRPATAARFSARARLALPFAAAAACLTRTRAALAAPTAQGTSMTALRTVGPFPTGATVALRGTPHLWVADERGTLHWGGDTRALQGRTVRGDVRIEVSLDQLKTLPRGEPWLSAGLVKIGDPIYLAKWEASEAQPRLLHVRDIRDLELFGIQAENYGALVRDRAAWEAAYGFKTDALARDVLPAAAALGETPGADRWLPYRSAGGKFGGCVPLSVRPQVTLNTGAQTGHPGVLESRGLRIEMTHDGGDLILMVAAFVLTPALLREWTESPDSWDDGSNTYRVAEERSLRIGAYEVSEARMELTAETIAARLPGDPTVMTARTVRGVENRWYWTYAFYRPSEAALSDSARFLDSFMLLP